MSIPIRHTAFLTFLVFAAMAVSLSCYTVDQREQALVLQLGQPVGDIKGPGLHFRIPVIQEVRRFDGRILSVDPPPAQVVISSNREKPVEQVTADDDIASGEPIIVDTFARYRITDPLKFLKSLGTVAAADQRLESIMNDATRTILGQKTLANLLSPGRTAIMQAILKRVNGKIEGDNLGISVIDIRIVRADLTPELRASTVRRMISELKERATETRSEGEQHATEIRSTADKERAIILAEAQRDGQVIRGEGDKDAIKIYADAYNKDKDFYAFTRSLAAYRGTMANPETRLLLSPDSAFLKYFKNGP